MLAYTTEFDENWTQEDIAGNTTVAEFLDVSFTAGDVSFDTTTDTDGNFTITLPGDLTYVLKAATTGNTYGVGQTVEPNGASEVDVGEIYLKRLTTVSGIISVTGDNANWNTQNYNGLLPTIVAIDEQGIEWEATVTNSGDFTVAIANGIYDFTSKEAEYNISTIEDFEVSNFVNASFVALTSDLEPMNIEVMVCLVAESLGDCSEGTPKFANVEFIPSFYNHTYNLTEVDFDEQGMSSLSVMPGTYVVQTSYTNADDENATDFNTFSTSQEVFVSMFADDNKQVIIELSDERLFTGKVSVGSDNLSNVQFLLYNESNDQFLSATTNDYGNFSEYIPSGEWLVIISPQAVENTTYTLRYPIVIDDDSSTRTDLNLILAEAVTVNFTLTESLTDEYVTGARVIAVSNDGFGNVTLAPSDDGGNVSDQIMPGSWTLSLDKETGDKLWTITEGEYIFDATGDEDVELGVVEAELQVMIGGKIFWDWNENGMVDFTESIADVNVTISSTDGTVLHEVKTDELGVWFQSVPIMQTYNVSVEKSGYSSGYYQSNGTEGIIVNTSSVIEDLAIVADLSLIHI